MNSSAASVITLVFTRIGIDGAQRFGGTPVPGLD